MYFKGLFDHSMWSYESLPIHLDRSLISFVWNSCPDWLIFRSYINLVEVNRPL